MEEIRLWKIVCEAGEKPKAAPVETVDKTTTEKLLEDALTGAPDLLMPNLHLICRQPEAPCGPLDLLGVDEDGRLVVFELKRGILYRDVVAQAIDYGSYLDDLEPEELCRLINANSGKGGTERIEDFAQWYGTEFGRPVADIGRPRIMLVGLGVDERAKRMVKFLAKCELDMSLITYHGFNQGGETLLARQVEVQSKPPDGATVRQAKLDKHLAGLGIEQNYAALVAAVKQGLGESAYRRPNPTGYSFSLPEVSDAGNPTVRAYLALYASESRKGHIQVNLQPRAIKAVGKERAEQFAKEMESKLELTPGGYGDIWIDGHKSATGYAEPLRSLGKAIATGWKAKMENQAKAKAEASEASGNP
jgi:hypothetical protein